MSSYKYDIAVIGGGIIGTSTAMRLASSFPQLKVGVVEKEKAVAGHQTGHNSGVIHSGIYYAPGSLKAQNCVSGAAQLMAFCREHGIEYELCGKVIVATSPEELPRLDELYRRGTLNGVPGLEMIDAARLKEIEPEAAGIRALLSPNTGIIDFTQVTKAYAGELQKSGGEIVFNARVDAIEQRGDSTRLITTAGDIETRHLINCAGLYADRVAEMMDMEPDVRIIPFRGEYYFLKPEARRLVKGLIYPVPNPEFPFLGVHFTKSIHGGVEAGPNAVLALAREGYTKVAIRPTESAWSLGYPGFWRMARKYWKTGLEEVYRSFSKKAFTQALQRLVPAVRASDLQSGGAGVRAQAVDRTGKLVDDFRIVEGRNAIHVLNAPSPGATASLAISAGILEMAERAFGLEKPVQRNRAQSQKNAR
jgi:L-2-hydroxyglutarate oxidase LhgO